MRPLRVLVADPAWSFSDRLPGESRGAAKNYRVTALEKLCTWKLPPIADSALLLLWRVAAMQEEALRVCRAWGFVPKTELVWVKTRPCRAHRPPPKGASTLVRTDDCPDCARKRGALDLHFGMGRYTRAAHESAIIGARGAILPRIKDHGQRSVIVAAFRGHSVKPEEAQDLLERLVPTGPYGELFARREREGWFVFGDQVPEARHA